MPVFLLQQQDTSKFELTLRFIILILIEINSYKLEGKKRWNILFMYIFTIYIHILLTNLCLRWLVVGLGPSLWKDGSERDYMPTG